MEKIKRYFEYWEKDTLILVTVVTCLLILLGTSLTLIPAETKISDEWQWQYTLMIIVVILGVLHVLIVKFVQSIFTLVRPRGSQYATVVVKEDGEVVALNTAVWGKGKIVKIIWKDGSRCQAREAIELSCILSSKIDDVTISTPLNIKIKLLMYTDPVCLYKLLSDNYPHEIKDKEELSVDDYFNKIIEKISINNEALIDVTSKEYLYGYSDTFLINKLTRDLVIDDIYFPGADPIFKYEIGNPELYKVKKAN